MQHTAAADCCRPIAAERLCHKREALPVQLQLTAELPLLQPLHRLTGITAAHGSLPSCSVLVADSGARCRFTCEGFRLGSILQGLTAHRRASIAVAAAADAC